MKLSYRQLADLISTMTEGQKDTEVNVIFANELYPVILKIEEAGTNVLKQGQPYMEPLHEEFSIEETINFMYDKYLAGEYDGRDKAFMSGFYGFEMDMEFLSKEKADAVRKKMSSSSVIN